jgi:hypothetical protein
MFRYLVNQIVYPNRINKNMSVIAVSRGKMIDLPKAGEKPISRVTRY